MSTQPGQRGAIPVDQRVNLGIGTVAIGCNSFYSFSRKSHKSDFKFCVLFTRPDRQLDTYLINLWLSTLVGYVALWVHVGPTLSTRFFIFFV